MICCNTLNGLLNPLPTTMKTDRTSRTPKVYWGGGVEKFTCLCITDSNTTGALDTEDDTSPWKALTKGSGYSSKPSKSASGSFGVGKFASFTSTYLRTVLYSTAFQNNGRLEHRFQGKTILVSHRDGSGNPLQSIGYLGDGFGPLKNQEVPAQVKMKEPGTSLYIPYYHFGGIGKWLHDSTSIILENFFHAIIHGNLQVQFKDSHEGEFPTRTIDKKTSSEYQREIAEDSITYRLMKVSKGSQKVSKGPQAERSFKNVGDFSLRIDVNPNTQKREIGLVRDAGMLITSDKQKMFPGIKRIPAHWWGFTAIIECQSKGKALLRQAESPRHDHISADYIRDAEIRNDAKEMFKEIGYWCFEEIKKLAEPEPGSESVNVDELAPYLGIDSDTTLETDSEVTGSEGEPVVSEPERTFRGPSQHKKKPAKAKIVIEDIAESITEDDTGDDSEEVERTDDPVKTPTNKKRKVRVIPQKFIRVRFRTGSNPTHSVIVTFDPPSGEPAKIEMNAIGEDGNRYLMGVREAVHNGEPLPVKNDQVTLPDTDQERQSIEIVTRDPVQNKSFDLRFIR